VEELVVVFGLNEPANLRIMATTFKEGDPSYAGALGGIALGLESYHIFELKEAIPEDAWAEEMTFEELEAGDELIEEICQTMREVREA
jgi:hypothetical protein